MHLHFSFEHNFIKYSLKFAVFISALLISQCMNSDQYSQEECVGWKNGGLCKSDEWEQFMLDHCKKTCGKCTFPCDEFTYMNKSHLMYSNWVKEEPNNVNCQEHCSTLVVD